MRDESVSSKGARLNDADLSGARLHNPNLEGTRTTDGGLPVMLDEE